MSQGGLQGKLIARNFWPTCETCVRFAACQTRPFHPAYPHSWHWGREVAEFFDGTLILRSWVGSSAIGQPHTGCKSYEVNPTFITDPQEHHRQYLALEHEKGRLESEMESLERKKAWTKNDEDFHASLFRRYRQILKQQTALRSTTSEAQPLAVAVNE
jgi:hypothetical protein